VFYTSGWYYSNNLGVREISNLFRKNFNRQLKKEITLARIRIAEKHLNSELNLANLVIEGKVVETDSSLTEFEKHVIESEHNPRLRPAKILINEVLKGKKSSKTVLVYYASSDDVAWISAPKLKKDQRAIFILKRGTGIPILKKDEFAIIDPRQVQPIGQSGTIKRLLKK